MKKFVLLVLCFVFVALKAKAASGPDLAMYRPKGWTSPLICSLKRDATSPDYTLKAGVPTYVKFAIKNIGNETAGVGDYVIMFDTEVIMEGVAPVTLAPGDTLVIYRQFTFDSTGVHMVRCKVDYDESLDELDESNNGMSASYEWIEVGPDLAMYRPKGWTSPLICSLKRDATSPDYTLKAGVPVYVKFAIKNIGNETAGVGDYVIMFDTEVIMEGVAPVTLAPGDTLVIYRQFTFDSTGVHMVRCKVDYDENLDELDEFNNGMSASYEWIVEPEGEVNLYDEGGVVNISFPPYSFDDPHGDVNDPLGCVFVDNRFLTKFSPEQIEEGNFSYADNPELNDYIKEVLHDLGTCSLYVFIEGELSGTKYSYSEAAKFDIDGDNYERTGSAQIWQALEDTTYKRFTDLREAREIIEDSNWNFTADLTLHFMGVPQFDETLSRNSGSDICEPCFSMEPTGFDEEGVVKTYSGTPLDESFDWRDKDGVNWMTSVKNQTYIFRDEAEGEFRLRYCGSCYIMGVFGTVEAFYNIGIQKNPDFDLDLSEQHFICKNTDDNTNPCKGGNSGTVYLYLKTDGVVTEDCLPYVANTTSCGLCGVGESQVTKVTDYIKVERTENLEEWRNIIKENLLETPLTFEVGYTDDGTYRLTYSAYSEGIFPLWHDGGLHTMVLVGWGDGYWIVKNSVGPDWGDNGYIKMKMANTIEESIGHFIKPILARPEFGMISVNQNTDAEWHSVDFTHNFIHPIVVMGPSSYNDTEATTIRVKDVTEDGFKFQLDPWDLEDGSHGTETISYVVMEEDVQDIGGGVWEAGSVSGVDHRWKTVNLKSGDFDGPPVILTQTIKNYYASPLVTRINDVTSNSFKVKLDQQELGEDFIAPPEEVHYIAIQPNSGEFRGRKFLVSRTGNNVTHEWYNEDWNSFDSPMFIARIQGYNEVDACGLRYRDISNSGIYLKVEEEQSGDTEVEHSAEDIGYLVVSGSPEAPSELTANAVTDPRLYINLDWVNNSDNIYFFKIERKEGSDTFDSLTTAGGEYGDSILWPDYNVEPGKTYTYRIKAYSSGTGYSAYSNEASETTPGDAIYEFQKISISQSSSSEWHTVDFSHTYNNPIVVMGPPSYNNSDPTTIRVKDVTNDGFKFQLDEWDYLNGSHPNETISYIVMEKDVHDIGGGIWEADFISEVNHNWKTVNFQSGDFDEAPVVLAQTVTSNNTPAVTVQIKDVTASSFKIRLQEQQDGDGIIDPPEKVHYISIQPNQGELDGRKFLVHKRANCLSYIWWHTWHNEDWTDLIGNIEVPIFIAGMQSCDEIDPSDLRYRDLSESGVYLRVEEENSTNHGGIHWRSEDLGYLVISGLEPELSTFTTSEDIYENYIKLASPIVTGNLILNISSNNDRKASIELIDIAGRVVERKKLNLRRGREDLSLGQFRSGVYFLRIQSDEDNKPEVHKITVLR